MIIIYPLFFLQFLQNKKADFHLSTSSQIFWPTLNYLLLWEYLFIFSLYPWLHSLLRDNPYNKKLCPKRDISFISPQWEHVFWFSFFYLYRNHFKFGKNICFLQLILTKTTFYLFIYLYITDYFYYIYMLLVSWFLDGLSEFPLTN